MDKKITKVIYAFNDASVPPQYHQSYTITVTKDQAHIIIDSYGDILAEKTIELPEHKLVELAKYIKLCHIREKESNDNLEPCTGGTSKSLTIYSGENTILSGTIDQCGGLTSGNLYGDTDSFAEKMKGLFPEFDELLK